MVENLQIGSSFELSDTTSSIIQDRLELLDGRVANTLRAGGFTEENAERFKQLWSMGTLCLTSLDFCKDLIEAGVSARPLINEKAIDIEIPIGMFGLKYGNVKDHVIAEVQDQGRTFYLDPTWAQFLEDFGVRIEDIQSNTGVTFLPPERVICYQADEVSDLADWFSQIVRAVHNKAANGVLRGKSDMLTRELTPSDLFFNAGEISPPANYDSIERLEEVARRIWAPEYYIPLTDEKRREIETPRR